MRRLDGKVALISGTASGQGRAAALRFAAEGALVVGGDLLHEQALETQQLIAREGGTALTPGPLNVTDEQSVSSWVHEAVDAFGGIDIVYAGAARITGANLVVDGDCSAVLLRDGRLDDAIAVAEPGFGWYDCSNLLAPLVYPLLDRPEELLHLVEHPSVVPHYDHAEFQHWWRAFALAGLSRVDEAIAVAEAHPDPWTDLRIVKAGLLSTAGHLDAAAAELRALGTIEAREELFEVLISQGQAAEAIAVHPTVAEQRAAKPKPKPEPVPLSEDGYSLEPPF
ncbi:SDR family NAD(P)-dependent oxidoreductase [Streptomyces sp. NPDC086182]|uniref:SDR family NAD(P)-dependent oxidoreductase n=1 Tax=Streptomyces sp. NPDC086182 TaxID=3155058 RepID=UPI003418EB92